MNTKYKPLADKLYREIGTREEDQIITRHNMCRLTVDDHCSERSSFSQHLKNQVQIIRK